MDAKAASFVRIVREDGALKPTLAECKHFDLPENSEEALAAVKKWARKLGAGQASCTTVLDASEYRLLTTEAPEVPKEEMRSALRWKIKDLIDFPAQEATLDVFDLPGAQAGAKGQSVYVVAARSDAIRRRVELLSKVQVNLKIVDILEMCQRNIAALLPEDAAGVAVLSLSTNGGLITLTKQSKLYLTRNLKVGLDDMLHPTRQMATLDQTLLELQRSLDFFESHFRQPAIRNIFLMPSEVEVPGLLDAFQRNLGLKAAYLDFEQLLECPVSLPEGWQARHSIAIGAALRQETTA